VSFVDYHDGFTAQAASANQGPFVLIGGKYGVSFVAAVAGTVKLQIMGPDAATFIDVGASTSFTTTSGFAVVDLPPGKYQISIATATGVNVSVIPISYRK
jgi:hypothetical protein